MGVPPYFPKSTAFLVTAVLLALVIMGCGRPAVRPSAPVTKTPEKKPIPRLGYTIQVGAFANVENADRLTKSIQDKGVPATYFMAAEGLYKVRFGNFTSKEAARFKAEELRQSGIIEEFYIVNPEEYPVSRSADKGEDYLREELVRSAKSFVGVPYLWGGASKEAGFDCSGLTMTVYQLSGFDLPRTSQEQYMLGNPVDVSFVEKGDLVFFTFTGNKVSHVGIYVGNGQFIHAPESGKHIKTDFLSNRYFNQRFVGARSYL